MWGPPPLIAPFIQWQQYTHSVASVDSSNDVTISTPLLSAVRACVPRESAAGPIIMIDRAQTVHISPGGTCLTSLSFSMTLADDAKGACSVNLLSTAIVAGCGDPASGTGITSGGGGSANSTSMTFPAGGAVSLANATFVSITSERSMRDAHVWMPLPAAGSRRVCRVLSCM